MFLLSEAKTREILIPHDTGVSFAQDGFSANVKIIISDLL